MKRLRYMRRLLNRQLARIHAGRIAEARQLSTAIADIAATLERRPPAGDRLLIDTWRQQCAELNEIILEHFHREKEELGEALFHLRLERELRRLRESD